jgi:hypothetical protein
MVGTTLFAKSKVIRFGRSSQVDAIRPRRNIRGEPSESVRQYRSPPWSVTHGQIATRWLQVGVRPVVIDVP